MAVLGIDIGGTGIKGAPVDPASGELLAPRYRILTPSPATPELVAPVIAEIVSHFSWTGPVGCAFPGVVKAGHTLTAANLAPEWIGVDADALFTARSGCSVTLMNDADAAGLAELAFGAGRERRDVVLMLTLGTGIGSALFHDGVLVPNTEFGHLTMGDTDAEQQAAARVRSERKLSWKEYAAILNEYLALVEKVLWPDLIILGGGISKKADKWMPFLRANAELAAAALANDAGIVGAAHWATIWPDEGDHAAGDHGRGEPGPSSPAGC